jgi:hypothetical protein
MSITILPYNPALLFEVLPRLCKPQRPFPIDVPLLATPVMASDVNVNKFQIEPKNPRALGFFLECLLALASNSWNGHLLSCLTSIKI